MAVVVTLASSGIKTLLTSTAVRGMLLDLAVDVAAAAAARAIMVDDGQEALPIKTVDASDSTRARVLIVAEHAAALAAESKYRVLGGALDAART